MARGSAVRVKSEPREGDASRAECVPRKAIAPVWPEEFFRVERRWTVSPHLELSAGGREVGRAMCAAATWEMRAAKPNSRRYRRTSPTFDTGNVGRPCENTRASKKASRPAGATRKQSRSAGG